MIEDYHSTAAIFLIWLPLLVVAGIFVLGFVAVLKRRKAYYSSNMPASVKETAEPEIENLSIQNGILKIDGLAFKMGTFQGNATPAIVDRFRKYVYRGLEKREPSGYTLSGRLKSTSYVKTGKSMNLVRLMLVVMLAGLSLYSCVEQILFDSKPGLWLVALILILTFSNIFLPGVKRFYSPVWRLSGGRINFEGRLREKSFGISEIEKLDFGVVPGAFHFEIKFRHDENINIASKRFRDFLPLYDALVTRRPELAFRVEEDEGREERPG